MERVFKVAENFAIDQPVTKSKIRSTESTQTGFTTRYKICSTAGKTKRLPVKVRARCTHFKQCNDSTVRLSFFHSESELY